MVKGPTIINVKVRGARRLIVRTNKIIANVNAEVEKGTTSLIRQAQKIARNEIRENTRGNNILASSIIVKTEKTIRQGNKVIRQTLDINSAVAKRYAKFVHDGFRSHWVHKDMIANWLAKHPNVKLRSGKWLEVGYPKTTPRSDGSAKQSAHWLPEGGVKYFDKAFAQILNISREEYAKRLKTAIRGKK